jgi:hypothetical protein
VLAVVFVMAAVLLAGFASSSASFAGQTVPPTTTPPTTTVPVEVGGKVVVQSPEKSPVDDDLATTGPGRAVTLTAVGLILAGVGLVLIDVTHHPEPAVHTHAPLPGRVSASRRRRSG